MNKENAFYIGDTIKRLRKQIRLSQEELAHRCKINRGHMSDLELNKKHPKLETVFKLAKGLELAPDGLMKEIANNIDFDKIFVNLLER